MSRLSRRLARKQQQQQQQRTGRSTLPRSELLGDLAPLRPGVALTEQVPPELEHLPKLSESLMALASPLVEPLAQKGNEPMVAKLYELAAVAWNAGLWELQGNQKAAEATREPVMSRLRASGGTSEERAKLAEAFEQLVSVRKTRFAHDPRFVDSVKVVKTPRGISVTVATLVVPAVP